MPNKIKSFEIVTMSLYSLGGSTNMIHTEDVAIESDKKDPERFKWKKYKKNIDRGLILECLNSARNRKKGAYVKGNDEKGWMLTQIGLEYCLNVKNTFSKNIIRKKRISKIDKKYLIREENRIKSTDAYIKFKSGDKIDITETDLKNLFKIDDYSTKDDIQKRANNLLENFNKDKIIYNLIEAFQKQAIKIVR